MKEIKYIAGTGILFCLVFLFYTYLPDSIPFLSTEISLIAVPLFSGLLVAMGIYYYFK